MELEIAKEEDDTELYTMGANSPDLPDSLRRYFKDILRKHGQKGGNVVMDGNMVKLVSQNRVLACDNDTDYIRLVKQKLESGTINSVEELKEYTSPEGFMQYVRTKRNYPDSIRLLVREIRETFLSPDQRREFDSIIASAFNPGQENPFG